MIKADIKRDHLTSSPAEIVTRNLATASDAAKKLVLGKTVNGVSRNIFRLRAAYGFIMRNPRSMKDNEAFFKLADLKDTTGNKILFFDSDHDQGNITNVCFSIAVMIRVYFRKTICNSCNTKEP